MSTSNIIEKMVYVMGQNKIVKDPKMFNQNKEDQVKVIILVKKCISKNIAYSLKKNTVKII